MTYRAVGQANRQFAFDAFVDFVVQHNQYSQNSDNVRDEAS